METKQRYRYEMLLRVSDYGMEHKEVFPEAVVQTFARVTAAVAAVDGRMKNQVLAKAEAGPVKAATRAAVFDYLKTIAAAARRVTRPESQVNPFKLPAKRSLKVEIATARAFLEEAETRREAFVRLGLAPLTVRRTTMIEHSSAVLLLALDNDDIFGSLTGTFDGTCTA